MSRVASAASGHWPLVAVLALVMVTVAVVNPLREMAFSDDWAYARAVGHLVETGTYKLDDWAAANPIFQTYWAALFVTLFGYSFASLKVSTLSLMIGGVVGMYWLAREHGFSAATSALLAFILLGNPLMLVLSFSFMTDVPFLSCVILAFAAYTRAIRLGRYPLMFLGSLAAAAAVLIRPFGAAFVPGLGLVWLTSGRRRATMLLFAVGAIMPAVAAGYQVAAGLGPLNWAIPLHVQWQRDYLAQGWILIPEWVWRIVVVLDYLAFFTLPLLPVALAEWWSAISGSVSQRAVGRAFWRELALAVGLVLFLGGMSVLGVVLLKRTWLMPILPWDLQDIAGWPEGFVIVLSLITLGGAFLLSRIFLLRYGRRGEWSKAADHERLLDCVTLLFLLLQISFFQFGDEYLLHFVPLALVAVGRHAGAWLDRLGTPTWARAAAVLVVGMLWVRGTQAGAQAAWSAGEQLLAQGVAPAQIHTAWEWQSYHGAFDDYLAAHDRNPPNAREGYFEDWLQQVAKSALYQIKRKPLSGNQWKLINTISFQDMWFQGQKIYVYRRNQ